MKVCSCGRKLKTRNICSTCRSKKWRDSHPVEYSYRNLKNRAGQRKTKRWPDGIPFTITLEEFREFCYEYKYIQGKGKSSIGLSVDRDNEELGYVRGNLKAIPLGDNVRKYHKTKRCNWVGPNSFVAATEYEMPEEDKYF